MKYEYLLFNLIITSGPILGYLLYPKATLPNAKAVAKAIFFVSLPFILWDHTITNHFWFFNERFTTGLNLGSLPIEEVLFFLTVPTSCLFLWVNLKKTIPSSKPISPAITLFTSIGFFILSLYFLNQNLTYSFQVTLLLSLTILLLLFKSPLLLQKKFFLFLGLVLLLTLIFNGYLTARPVVIYNPNLKTNLNILTVPIEDFLYSLILNSSFVFIYEKTKSSL